MSKLTQDKKGMLQPAFGRARGLGAVLSNKAISWYGINGSVVVSPEPRALSEGIVYKAAGRCNSPCR